MVNHKGFGRFRSGKLPADEAVGVLDTLAEGVVTCQIICFVGLVEHTKCLEGVSGKDEGVGGRVPDMRFYGVVVPVVVMMSCFGGMGMILWACSFSGFEDFNAWYATSVGVFGMIGIILVVLMILYLKDYGAAKKLQQYK